ncbi:hypothetical protein BOX15_Mlig017202g1 [Macrostomum lignano]|nr:hypothetical protein BOX15_Mlig017202g1 [Macrostomum lignano]
MASISEDYSRANPKVGSVIPPYNAQKDNYVKTYFDFIGVKKTLNKNKQNPPGTCVEGPAMERFFTSGHGKQYLTPRNERQGNGYSNEERMGHGKLWRHPNPEIAQYERQPPEFQGYNGRFGYRRTTPRLRQEPSPFGVNTETPIY